MLGGDYSGLDYNWIGKLAPEFPEDLVWLNSKPKLMAELVGQVVMLDFWRYSCVNSVRSIEYVKKWYERYHTIGLEIIGVHSPEYDFEEEQGNVERAVKELGISYPVIHDRDRELWHLYHNASWPRKFLLDTQGMIVGDHLGEGGYAHTETLIQELIQRTSRKRITFPRISEARKGDPKAPHATCYRSTPSQYMGYNKGTVGNFFGMTELDSGVYHDDTEHDLNQWYLQGQWTSGPQFIQHARENRTFRDYLAVRYQGLTVNVVAAKKGRVHDLVKVTLDGQPLTLENRGNDIELIDGHSYLKISSPKLYNIISSPIFHQGELRLYTKSPNTQIYSLSFGSCAGTRI